MQAYRLSTQFRFMEQKVSSPNFSARFLVIHSSRVTYRIKRSQNYLAQYPILVNEKKEEGREINLACASVDCTN